MKDKKKHREKGLGFIQFKRGGHTRIRKHLFSFFFLLLTAISLACPYVNTARAGLLGSLDAVGGRFSDGEVDGPPATSIYQPVNQPGFDDEYNRYAWSMTQFKGRLYVGTWNTDKFNTRETNGAAIYRYVDGTQWEKVVEGGLSDATNMYAWNGIVYDNGNGPRLYIGTCNPNKGFFLYSVTSDLQWSVEVGAGSAYPSGFGDVDSYGIRSFGVYDGKLVLGLACMPKPVQVWMGW